MFAGLPGSPTRECIGAGVMKSIPRREQPARDPRAYVHGLEGPVAVVPGRVAWWLEQTVLRELRVEVRGEDPEVDAVLIAIRNTGLAWLNAVDGTTKRQLERLAGESELTVDEAANRLRISPSGVRMAIRQRRLKASKRGRQWGITVNDLEEFEKRRRHAA